MVKCMEKVRIGFVSFFNRFCEYPTQYSLGVLRIAAYIMNKDVEIAIFPFDLDDPEEFERVMQEIDEAKVDILGISAYIWTWDVLCRIVRSLKDKVSLIVVGGPEVQNRTDQVQNDGRCFFVSGEGEAFWDALISASRKVSSDLFVDRKSLDLFSKNGHYEVSKSQELVYGMPVFCDEFWERIGRAPSLDFCWFETSRGCPYNCGYCGHKSRNSLGLFDLDFVEEEIRFIGRKQIKKVFVVDPIMGGIPANGKRVLQLFIQYAPNTRLIVYLRPEYLDEEYIDLLGHANVEEIRIGIQTLNSSVPKWIRNNSIEAISGRLHCLSEKGIPWRAELIVGLPGDTVLGFYESIKYIMDEVHPTFLYAYHLSVLKETPLFELTKKMGELWIETNLDGVSAKCSNTYSEEEMKMMLAVADKINTKYNLNVVKNQNGTFNTISNYAEFKERYLGSYA